MYSRITTLLLFMFLMATACHKPKEQITPATFTTGIDRVRNWKGHHHYEAYGKHYTTPVYEDWDFADTTFAITRVDDGRIIIGTTSLDYESSDSTKQVHYFGGAKYYYLYGSSRGIAYFYTKDSIVWVLGDKHGTDDTWTLDDIYHTY